MKEIAEKTTLCPSARPEPGESFVFGIIGGTVAHILHLEIVMSIP